MRKLLHDEKSQLTVLEAVVSIGIIFVTLIFVYQGMTTPIEVSPFPTSKLKVLCDDALYQLWSTPSFSGKYGSLLAELILENNTAGFNENISKLLPPNTFYNVWIYDGVNRYLWYPVDTPNEPIGSVVVSHQMISDGYQVISVELEAWEV